MTRFCSLAVLAVVIAGVAPRSHAASIAYFAHLDGASENPSNASPGTGSARVDFDIVAHMMRVRVTFSDLLGTTTASHIHSPATPPDGLAGVATTTPTFTDFPLDVTSGNYDHTFDTSVDSTYNPAYITANGGTAAGAEAALAASLAAGTAYLNIHTTSFPGGEIRGFLSVPEPGSIGLLAIGALGLLFSAGRARR